MNVKRFYKRILRIPAYVLLLVFLLICMVLPVIAKPDSYLADIQTQRIRCQRIAKDALILENEPAGDELTQGYSELQNMLSGWQSEQAFLLRLHSENIQQEMSQSTGDYTSITNAMKMLLTTPDKNTTTIQTSIILDHERAYTLSLSQVAAFLESDIEMAQIHLLIWEYAFVCLLVILWIGDAAVVRKDQSKRREEAHE